MADRASTPAVITTVAAGPGTRAGTSWDTGRVTRTGQGGEDPETVTLRVPLPRRVAQDLVALAELYHATPERMIASWTQTHVDNLMAGLTPSGAEPQPDLPPDVGPDERNQPSD